MTFRLNNSIFHGIKNNFYRGYLTINHLKSILYILLMTYKHSIILNVHNNWIVNITNIMIKAMGINQQQCNIEILIRETAKLLKYTITDLLYCNEKCFPLKYCKINNILIDIKNKKIFFIIKNQLIGSGIISFNNNIVMDCSLQNYINKTLII